MRELQGTEHRARWRRLDGPQKAAGLLTFGVDMTVPGMLHAKVARSTISHGILREVDVRRAQQLPGVRAILVGADVPTIRLGRTVLDEPVLAVDRVRYCGEPVAAVAATDEESALRAVAAIRVEIDPLPVIADAESALDEAMPDLHPDWQNYQRAPGIVGGRNIQNTASIVRGDVDAEFARAAHVHRGRYRAAQVHQLSLEGRVAIAEVDADGSVLVTTSHQYPFGLRADLARILGKPQDTIRITVPGVGGGFGGKLYAGVEPLAILLAERAGAPVRLALSREEELLATSPRMSAIVDIATALDEQGNILARDAALLFDAGAYCESSPAVISVGIMTVPGPYRMNAFRARATAVYTNKTGTGSMRAPAAPQAVFAGESQIDEIAHELGIDPVDLRLRNVLRRGDISPLGQVVADDGMAATLRAAAREIGWTDTLPDGVGMGLACGMWTTAAGTSNAEMSLLDDGRFKLVSGAIEIGTGAVQATMLRSCCETLGIPPNQLLYEPPDTAVAGHDHGSQGSRTAIQAGTAAIEAAERLRDRLVEAAAKEWQRAPNEIVWQDGEAHCLVTGQVMSSAELAALARDRGRYTGSGTYTTHPAEPATDAVTEGMLVSVMNIPSWYAHAAKVVVDPATGGVVVLDYVAAHDCGAMLDEPYARGQVEGGVVQGLGQALTEELIYVDGVLTNPTLTDYKLLTVADVPRIRVWFPEARAGEHVEPKGIGEPPVIPTGAVVANAIARAVGIRVRELPVTAERCWLKLNAEDGTGS